MGLTGFAGFTGFIGLVGFVVGLRVGWGLQQFPSLGCANRQVLLGHLDQYRIGVFVPLNFLKGPHAKFLSGRVRCQLGGWRKTFSEHAAQISEGLDLSLRPARGHFCALGPQHSGRHADHLPGTWETLNPKP